MASIWKLDNNDIYIDADSADHSASIAELNPINSSESIFHSLFVPTSKRTIAGTVIGFTALDNIVDTANTVVTLASDLVPAGISVLVQSVQYQRVNVFAQKVDSSLPVTSPVYKVTVVVRPQ